LNELFKKSRWPRFLAYPVGRTIAVGRRFDDLKWDQVSERHYNNDDLSNLSTDSSRARFAYWKPEVEICHDNIPQYSTEPHRCQL